ncbi:MAG: TonB-dependent receptor [Bacteroidales bacterium]|nr:TonB-dependent receptor [Bacteroidales bacterium]
MKNILNLRNWHRRLLLSVFLICLVIPWAVAQEVTITGTVTSQEGNTLPGVTILVKGTQRGTITDANGNYMIKLSNADSVLVFSFVGYVTQEVRVGSRKVINVTLSVSTEKLDEVVVVGYGTQSRATVTTSVSKVTEESIKNVPVASSPVTALIGKISGVNIVQTDGRPTASPKIWIRGGTDTNPTNDHPLYIINGIVRSDMDDINPDDIESIDILKDAASTAMYGARAANGIVIITTKRGKTGKAKFNFKYNRQYSSANRYKQDFLSPKDEMYYARIGIARASKVDGWTADYAGMLENSKWYGTGNTPSSRASLQYADDVRAYFGGVLPSTYMTITDPVTGRELAWEPVDWQDKVFQNGYAQNADMSISGGTDKLKYYSSLNYYNNNGVAPSTSYQRVSFTANGDYQISEKLKAGVSTSYQLLDQDFGRDGSGYRWFERSGRLPTSIRYYKFDDTVDRNIIGLDPGNGGKPNPEYWDQVTERGYYYGRLMLSSYLEWNIVDGLVFRPFIALNRTDYNGGVFNKASAYSTQRSAAAYNSASMNTQFDATLTYNKTLAGVHGINAILGTSFINDYSYDITSSANGASTDLIPTLNAASDENATAYSYLDLGAVQSWFGRVNYDYDKKYMLSLSMRIDGAANFSENNKWGYFPGVSAGWNIHRENFWKSNAISMLKLRGSWGLTGKNNINIFDTQGRYNATYQYDGQAGVLNTTLPNYDLIWESTSSYDAGVDMGLFNNNLKIILDYYHKTSYDRLYNKDLPAFTGFTSIKTNFGSFINRGFEAEMDYTPIANDKLRWDISLNWSYNRGTVGELPDNGKPKNRDGGFEHFDPSTGEYTFVGGYAEGERPDAMYANVWDGVFSTTADAAAWNAVTVDMQTKTHAPKQAGDTRWKDVDGNGLIENADRQFVGYKLPDHRGGLTNTLKYKGFTLRLVTDWALGHTIYDYGHVRILAECQGEDRIGVEIKNSWMQEGDVTDYPRFTYADLNGHTNYDKPGTNSYFYYKGDFLCIRELYLAYQLPQRLLHNLRLEDVNIYVTGHNLAYLTKYPGRNPEELDGVDRYMYPIPLTISTGISLNF